MTTATKRNSKMRTTRMAALETNSMTTPMTTVILAMVNVEILTFSNQ